MRAEVWIKRLAILAGLGILALVLVTLLRTTSLGDAVTWQRQASPGRLSAAHGFLENNCAACHNFGSAHFSGWNISMADGSVRSMNYDMDIELHRALASIAGGETASE